MSFVGSKVTLSKSTCRVALNRCGTFVLRLRNSRNCVSMTLTLYAPISTLPLSNSNFGQQKDVHAFSQPFCSIPRPLLARKMSLSMCRTELSSAHIGDAFMFVLL